MELLARLWPTFVALLLVAWIFAWLARRQQARGKWLGRTQRATISWLGSYTEGFQRVLDVLAHIGASIVDADPNRGYVIAASEGSFLTFGTTIRVTLNTQEGVTFVTLEAGPSALLDAGHSRSFLNRFLQSWDRLPSPVVL